MQQRFAVQQAKVVEIKTMLDEINQQLREQLVMNPQEDVNPIVSQQRFRYVQYLKMQIEHLREACRKEEQMLERIREELRQAHIKKKTLERLEEKQRIAYVKSLEEREQKEIEDIVISRRNRF